MRRESPRLPQWGTDNPGRARLCAAAWTVPFQKHIASSTALSSA